MNSTGQQPAADLGPASPAGTEAYEASNADGRAGRLLLVASFLTTLLGIGACAYLIHNSPPSSFDDAYMFIRYANNLLAGQGYSWNASDGPVYGCTSPLHVAVVTLLKYSLSRLGNAEILLWASSVPGFAAMLVLIAACGRFTRHPAFRGRYWVWGGLLIPALIFQEAFKYHLRTGMDTSLALLCNAVLILFTLHWVRRPGVPRLVPVVIAAYLSCLARPDNGLYATLFPLLCISLLGAGPRKRAAVTFAVAMAVVLGADLLVKWLYLGTALPLPFYAKRHGVYAHYVGMVNWNPVDYLQTFFGAVLPFLLVILLLAQRRTVYLLIAFFTPVLLTFLYYFSVNQIMGYNARLYFPAVPFFIVAAALVVDEWFVTRQGRNAAGHNELILRAMLAALVIFLGRQVAHTGAAIYERNYLTVPPVATGRVWTVAATTPLPALEKPTTIAGILHIARGLPPGTVFALSEHGQIGAEAPQVTIIDTVGLHDKEFALHGFSADALLRRRPDIMWLPHEHYTQMVRDIQDSDEFWRQYDYYPGVLVLGIAIRKDSPHYARLCELLEEAFAMVYPGLNPADYRARLVPGTASRTVSSPSGQAPR